MSRLRLNRWALRGAALAALIAAAAAAAVMASVSLAATCDETWTGPGGTTGSPVSGSYGTSTNWSPASVPSGSQNVCLGAGSYTVTVTGSQSAGTITVGAGVTLAIAIQSGNGAVLGLDSAATSTNSGTIELTDSDSTGTGSPVSRLLIGTGATLTNDGTIVSDPGPAGLGIRSIMGQSQSSTLDNASGGTMTINQDLLIDDNQAGLFATEGSITIPSGKKLLVDPAGAGLGGSPPKESAEMDIGGGTITDNGTFEQGFSETGIAGSAALKVSGGTITGAGLIAVSGAASDLAGSGVGASFSGSGTGTYTFVGSLSANATTLGGTIGSNQTVVLSANKTDGNPLFHVDTNVTNDGTLKLTDSETSGGSADEDYIQIGTGDTLTNDGTILSDPGPGGQGTRVITGSGTNTGTLLNGSTGTMTVNYPLQIDNGQAGVFTTQGTINIASGQTLLDAPGGGAVGGSPPTDTPTLNIAGGTITDTGNFDVAINTNGTPVGGPTVNVTGGTISGNPMILSQPWIDFSGAGSGTFRLVGNSSVFNGSILSGTIGSSDHVIADARAFPSYGGGTVLNVNSNVTNDGTLDVTDSDSSGSSVAANLEVGSGDTLTNDGTINFNAGPGSIGTRTLSGAVSNDSGHAINVNFPVGVGPSQPPQITNAGDVDVGSGQTLNLSGSYTQSSGITNLGGSGAKLVVPGTLLNGGQLTGSGTVQGDLTNGATVAPSPSPATINVTGNYTQSSAGALSAQVTSTGADKLAVTGTAALDGGLQISTASGFTPTVGQQFQVLTGSSVSGTFATTTGLGSGPYSVSYNPANVTLTTLASSVGAMFTPSSLTFGSPSDTIAAGSTVHETLKITASGTASLVIGTLSLTGPQQSSFSLSSDGCSGKTIPSGSSCTVDVGFSPAASGTYTAAVSVPDNAPGSPQHVSLTGDAGAAGPRADATPTSVDFGSVGVGVASATQSVTLSNTGSGALNISSVGLTGANASDYHITSDMCSGKSIAVGDSCSVGVSVTAGTTGSRVASLLFHDEAPDSPQTVALSASGSTTGTLSGRVLNGGVAGDPPLSGANVTVCLFATHSSCQGVNTGSNGTYSLSGLPPGVWQIEVDPSQSYLFAGGAVLTIQAGANMHDFTLAPPIGLSNGVTLNGRTGGVAVSFWTSPATLQAPFVLPTSGPAGKLGITTIQFWAHPLTGTGGSPYAVGAVSIVYKFDSTGAPKFVAMDTHPLSVPSGSGPSVGTWTTSATTSSGGAPVEGGGVSGYMAQGNFVPPPGGPDYHGAFLYQIHQWSLFTAPSGAASDAGPVATTAQAGDPGSTLLEAERCLRQSNTTPPPNCDPNPPPPPPGGCPRAQSPPFTFFNQSGTNHGIFDLGNGTVWNSATNTLEIGPGGTQIVLGGTGPTVYEPNGNPLGTNLSPGQSSSGATANPDGSISYDGFTFYPDGSVLAPGGQKYNPRGQQSSGPTPDDDCRPNYNYWHDVDGWQDPSGTVLSTKRIPVASAKVVLTRSSSHGGPFAVVPDGSLIMAPNNRRNPDHTSALGQFGWDVVAGFYRVSAGHAGCKAAGGGSTTLSPILTIPPAVTGIKLTLKCPHLKRRASHTKLTAHKVPVNLVALLVRVRGRHPQGTVTFKRGGRKLGVATLVNGRAGFMVPGTSTAGYRAAYSGDGHNAPSSGRG